MRFSNLTAGCSRLSPGSTRPTTVAVRAIPATNGVRCHFTDVRRRHTAITVIESFRHRGLRELFETGKTRRVAPDLQRRAKLRLDALEAAKALDDQRKPGFDFHALQGAVPQRYTIHINGPWCITFEFENGTAKRVDLEQYH